MRRQLLPAVVTFLALTLLCGIAYPLAVTGVAQVVFPSRADGSLVERDGRIIGSRLIGQSFQSPRYFHPRPSAAGDGYDAMSSSASNLGPTNPDLLDAVAERRTAYEQANGGPAPVDAVTASASGLDPHISPANALTQAGRVARERGLDLADLLRLIDEHTDGRSLGFLGEPGVNVLELNLALDQQA
ncbi:MAG TPA: potassium-transporting ATPase subunit KdpC [Gaiellaceae bacterium]|nr:potassium-transporting ATPase subunit KdpC [Gaiellaceae bacterium]